MKVAIIHCSFIYRGGGERIVFEQIDHLRKNGHEVECFAPVLDKEICFPDIIENYNIKTFLPQLPKWFPLRHAVLMLISSLLAPFFVFSFRKFDVILGENQPGAWIAFVISKLLNKKYVVYLNHPNRMLYPREHEDWAAVKDFKFLNNVFKVFRSILVYLDRVSISSASDRLVNGYFIGCEIEKIYGCDWKECPSGAAYFERSLKVNENESEHSSRQTLSDIFIGHPRYDSFFKADSPRNHLNSFLSADSIKENAWVSHVASSLNINGYDLGAEYILYTGRHQPWKRIDWLIESYAMLSDDLKSRVNLVIPGPFTPHTYDLIDLVKELGVSEKVLFVGEINQKQLEQLYRNASVYGFASEKEDFGIVVIEAMGYGLPVVAWNVGGPTDTIVDGKTGFLVEAYDKKIFSEKLNILLCDNGLRVKMGRAGIERIKERFSWERHMTTLETAMHV